MQALRDALAGSRDFHAGEPVRRALETIRTRIDFMQRDRAMDGDVRAICALIAAGDLVR